MSYSDSLLKQDFKDKMDDAGNVFSFPELYENAMFSIFTDFTLGDAELDSLCNILKQRRDFGLEKYKEYAFQRSIERCYSAPAVEHAIEEILDAMNYILHAAYQQMLKGNPISKNGLYGNVLENLLKCYKALSFLVPTK
jgi:hypothetical protein